MKLNSPFPVLLARGIFIDSKTMPDRILSDANSALRFFTALAQVLVTLWVGGMWVVGYVAAPTLFAMLDNSIVAGNIAGRLFTVVAWIGMGTAMYLLVFLALRQGRAVLRCAPFRVVAVMLVCVAVGYFGIQAEMTALKAGVGSMDVMESAARGRFRILHGISSSIYLLQSVLGLWLVAGWLRVL